MRVGVFLTFLHIMDLILSTFFSLWARQVGCGAVASMPPIVFVDRSWHVRIENADACGHVLQIVTSTYIPHGDVLNRAYLINGERVMDLPSLELFVANAAVAADEVKVEAPRPMAAAANVL